MKQTGDSTKKNIISIVLIFTLLMPLLSQAAESAAKNETTKSAPINPYQDVNFLTPNIKQLNGVVPGLGGLLKRLQEGLGGGAGSNWGKMTSNLKSELLRQKKEFKKKYNEFVKKVEGPINGVWKSISDFWNKD